MVTSLADLIRPIDHTYKERFANPEHLIYKQPGDQDIGTLCDICANACGRCSWSQKGVQEPVPGWDAVEGKIPVRYIAGRKYKYRYETSYTVLDCPEFVCDAHRTKWLAHWDKEKRRRELQRRSKRKQEE